MERREKIITASAFGALIGSGAVVQSFAHAAASPSDAGPDPFDNPDFALQNAMDVFDGLRDAADPMTPQMLHDVLDSLHISEQAKSDILKIEKELFGDKYQTGDTLSQNDLITLSEHAAAYLELSARGFTNISYSMELEKSQEKEARNDGVCDFSGERPSANNQQRLNDFKERIAPLPGTEEALQFLQDHRVIFRFAPLDSTFAGYYSSSDSYLQQGQWHYAGQSLLLNPDYSDQELVFIFFHEERHAEQMDQKIVHPPTRVSPLDMAWLTRVVEADASAHAVIEMFKLKLAGDDSCFNFGKTSSPYNRMYQAVENLYDKDPTSLENGYLMRAAFNAWFYTAHGDIMEAYDGYTLDKQWPAFDKSLAAQGVGKAELAREFVEKIGVLKGSDVNYLTLPDMSPIDHTYYKSGFSIADQKKLKTMTEAWEKTAPSTVKKKSSAYGLSAAK